MANRFTTNTGFSPKPGDLIDRKYCLKEEIGKGGTAKVWSATHTLGNFPCVVKLMNATPQAYEHALGEFRTLSNLAHPSIVRTFDMGLVAEQGHSYISMELVRGEELVPYVLGQKTVTPSVALQWLRDMVDVLAFIHHPEVRIIHKDIKPNNIIVGDHGAKLIDFNISTTGTPEMGTDAYKCPTVQQERRWTNYADLWALAVTFYEVLVGRPLFEEETSFDVDLSDPCPKGLPKQTFDCLKAIIRGEGQEDLEVNRYHELFGTKVQLTSWSEVPAHLASEFSISSKNQHFLTLAMMNQADPAKLRSKNELLKEALYGAGLPAGANQLKRLRGVFSQLKSLDVVEYGGKGNKRARLTEVFRGRMSDGYE